MQKKLNLQVKFREGFRPFAPAVTEEDASRFFHLEVSSPYMLLVAPVRDYVKPERADEQDLLERLYAWRGSLPAVTHVDGSARVQTVTEDSNGRFYRLLKKFGGITGVPILINTSFNVRGEPIVEHPQQAWECFLNTGLDMLVLGDFLLMKSAQKVKGDAEGFKKKFGGD
jgi:carbamoyltransferase